MDDKRKGRRRHEFHQFCSITINNKHCDVGFLSTVTDGGSHVNPLHFRMKSEGALCQRALSCSASFFEDSGLGKVFAETTHT